MLKHILTLIRFVVCIIYAQKLRRSFELSKISNYENFSLKERKLLDRKNVLLKLRCFGLNLFFLCSKEMDLKGQRAQAWF